jgi:phosphoribosylglycinamide formyltransferase 1
MFPAAKSRLAVLASGGGSNLQAILDYHDELGALRRGDVVLVASDRAAAGVLERARARGIEAVHLPRPSDASALGTLLEAHGVDAVVLAGYLRLVPAEIVRRFEARIVNVHPALLPAFGGPGMYGRRVHEAVLAAGARVSGATVHLVSEEYDRGPIVAQWPVPVLDDDTPERLAARVLRVEHLLLPRVVELLAAGRLAVGADGRVWRTPAADEGADARDELTFGGASLAASIDAALGVGPPAGQDQRWGAAGGGRRAAARGGPPPNT